MVLLLLLLLLLRLLADLDWRWLLVLRLLRCLLRLLELLVTRLASACFGWWREKLLQHQLDIGKVTAQLVELGLEVALEWPGFDGGMTGRVGLNCEPSGAIDGLCGSGSSSGRNLIEHGLVDGP